MVNQHLDHLTTHLVHHTHYHLQDSLNIHQDFHENAANLSTMMSNRTIFGKDGQKNLSIGELVHGIRVSVHKIGLKSVVKIFLIILIAAQDHIRSLQESAVTKVT